MIAADVTGAGVMRHCRAPPDVIAGLDPAIHLVAKKCFFGVLRSTMDPRVKPAGDRGRTGLESKSARYAEPCQCWPKPIARGAFPAALLVVGTFSRAMRKTRP